VFRKKNKKLTQEEVNAAIEKALEDTLDTIAKTTTHYLKSMREKLPAKEMPNELDANQILSTELMVMRQVLSPLNPLKVSAAVCKGFVDADWVARRNDDDTVAAFTYAPQKVEIVPTPKK